MINLDPYRMQKLKANDIEYIHCTFIGCKKVFLYKSELERHLITHDNSKTFACLYENCEKTFKRYDALRVHMQYHSDEPQFFCSVPGCDAKFKAKPALKYHLSKHRMSELQSLSSNALKQKNIPCVQIKRKDVSKSRRKNSNLSSKEWEEEEIEPKPTKFLFKEGGETKPDSSRRTLKQELLKANDDKELRELMYLYSHLMRENRDLKRQVADHMLSFPNTDTSENHSFVG